jgi:hypothetical protein
MTQLSDEDLGDLLTETFTAHEHLADPDWAVAIAASPGRSGRRGRVLLAAAASVALVAVGTAYVVSLGGPAGPEAGHQTPSPSTGSPPLPPRQTDAENLAAAVAEAERVASDLPAYPGAQETDRAGVPELGDITLSTVHPGSHTIVRSRFWTVTGVGSKTVARWYAAHPVAGFRSEGGPNAVGGESGDPGWINEVYWDDRSGDVNLAGTSVEIETTRTSTGVGVRATVSSVWPPARPPASFVQNVSSIEVRSEHQVLGQATQTTHRSFTVSDPHQILRAAVAFNDLAGMTPVVHSCPMQMNAYVDRIVFHTATGDVTAVNTSMSTICGSGMIVRRDGHRVDPQLRDVDQFLQVLGLDH